MSHPKIQIVGLGLATIDILMRLGQMPSWEYYNQIEAVKLEGGGMVATALVAASRLGVKTGYVGTTGCDGAGSLKKKWLVQEGVDTSHTITNSLPESQLALVFVHAITGERTFAAAQDFGTGVLQPEELDRDYILAADYLLIDGYHAEAALQAARWMRAAGKNVMLDSGKTDRAIPPELRALVPFTDVLISGSGFCQALTDERDLVEAGKAILQMGPKVVVETQGDRGCTTITAAETFHTPAFQVAVLDTTGAGDVFHGAYLVGLIHGWNLRFIAMFASAVSAIKCTCLGGRSGIPGMEETFEFLRRAGLANEKNLTKGKQGSMQ
jgi:sulfofructose kinase